MTEMNVSQNKTSQQNSYYLEVSLSDGEYTDSILVPQGDVNFISYLIDITDGNAIIEKSISEDENNILWVEHSTGEISPAVKFIRAKVTGGSGTLYMRAT